MNGVSVVWYIFAEHSSTTSMLALFLMESIKLLFYAALSNEHKMKYMMLSEYFKIVKYILGKTSSFNHAQKKCLYGTYVQTQLTN